MDIEDAAGSDELRTVMYALTESRGYRWHPCHGYDGSCRAFSFADIDAVFAAHVDRGDCAETDVVATGRLADGRFFYLRARCDTMGWECHSQCHVVFADTRKRLWHMAMDDEGRRKLPATLLRASDELEDACAQRDQVTGPVSDVDSPGAGSDVDSVS